MRKVIIFCSYIIAPLLILLGGLLIGGSCSYSSSAGPMNGDLSSVSSILGLLLIFISALRFKKQMEIHPKFSAIIILLCAFGLFCYGQYVIKDTQNFYENLDTQADIFPPNSGSLAIYYLTSFLAFIFGLILLSDKLDKSN